MLDDVLRPVRRIVSALVAHDAPGQLALGFALGMVIGLVPKGNLIALSLVVLLFSLRVNKGAGLLAALIFSWLGPALDPFADKLGAHVLTAPALQSTYAALFQMPLGPWFEFHNTVVVGSLLVGLWALYPVYWLSYLAFDWNQRRRGLAAATLRIHEPPCDEPVDRRAA
jgi:uncharacterized protein (TIGR03546 family)